MIDLILANPILPAMLAVAAGIALNELAKVRRAKPAPVPILEFHTPAIRDEFHHAAEWKRSA